MKILMTTDAVGGVWQYSLDLAVSLSGRGADILLATLGPPPSDEQRHQASVIPNVSLAESDFPLEWMAMPWSGIDASAEWLLQLQRDYRADVVHLNGYSHASLPWDVPTIIVAHSCVFSWWRAVHNQVPGPEWTEYKTRVTKGLHAAEAIVAPTAAMGRSLSYEYGVPEERIKAIANFTLANPATRPDKEPLILAAGRIWDVAKNLGPLSSVAPQLDWELLIADGTLAHSQLLNELTKAGIFVHPSLYEPFGLSVLEAARCQCSLILSDIPSLRELWDGAAVFVSPHDEQQWVVELNALAQDRERREHLGGLAFNRSMHYDAASSVHRYWRLYEELISSSRKKEVAA